MNYDKGKDLNIQSALWEELVRFIPQLVIISYHIL